MAPMPWPGAVAVSGGGDSLALMHLLADWSRKAGKPPPLVLSVDHGLNPASARDARRVARWAKDAGLACEILTVRGKKPKSDIEAWAREKRYALMAQRLSHYGVSALYLAHNQDDQAETFLLRLARGSGLDGLSAMRLLSPFPQAGFDGLVLARPLLNVSRRHLRDYLKARKQDWLEDPMNSQMRFARTRMRALLPALSEVGLSPGRIADAAAHLGRAREALELATAQVLAHAVAEHDGVLLLDAGALDKVPREIGLRALAAILKTVSGAAYRPRFESLERLFDALSSGRLGGGVTLHGCRIGPAPVRRRLFGPKTLVITRENSRAPAPRA